MAEAKEAKVETILRWVERAGEHAQAQVVEEVLIRDFHVSRVELDELWSYVRNKGEKGGIQRQGAEQRHLLVLAGDRDAFTPADRPGHRQA
ncbi:MAG TPA: hypothetical protein EYP09_02070 [Anaerolineae bacterium]|nr:hypothetical protein [Anaerolineae bacterium]